MIFRHAVAALLAASAVVASPVKRDMGLKWGKEKIRGVNIGGWLVLEPWITPSIFQKLDQSLGIIDEYTLCEKLPDQAPQILRDHWNNWVRYDDFAKIASAGFNLVRVPVGYWAYDNSNSPYVKGAADYIDAAIDWARGSGLKMIIDLHGAPGSQNGYDNSGQKLPVGQAKFLDGGVNGGQAQQALGVIRQISEKYAQESYQDVVVGIELVNEPFDLNRGDLAQYERDGFNIVRETSDTTVILSDAFSPPSSWNGFLTPRDNNAQNVAIDHHEYQVFNNDQVALAPWQHRQLVCNNAKSYGGADKWTFVGEWSAAMTDCAPALNGYNIGARYEGIYPGSTHVGSCAMFNNVANWPQSYKDDTRGYIEAQMEAFEQKTQGWIFWNFKTEAAHEWDAFALLDAGVFPNPVTDRRFGAICNDF